MQSSVFIYLNLGSPLAYKECQTIPREEGHSLKKIKLPPCLRGSISLLH